MSQEKVEIVATAKDQASATLKTLNRNVAALGNKGRGPLGGLLGGLGAISPVAIAAGLGIGAMTGLLAEGVRGAIEEEKQLAALSQALKDNVKDWDGSTAAMNDAARAAEDFAFTDDDARASLTKLVVATGDQTSAIKDMNLAMDIARGRNIDLAAATDIVIKANMGNVGALRRLGIEVKKGATSTEILAELTQRYAGQAAAFADTTEGKMQTARIAIDELAEDIGSLLVPAIGDAAQAMSLFLTNFDRPKQEIETKKNAFLNMLPSPEDVQARIKALQDLEHSYLYGDILDPKTTLFTFDIGGTKTELEKQISDLQTYLNTLIDPRDESALGIRLGQQITNSIAAGADATAPKAASDVGHSMTEAFYQYWSDKPFVKAGQDIPSALALGMKDNINTVRDEWKQYVKDLNHPFNAMKEIAFLNGKLTGRRLAAGLKSSDPITRAKAEQMRNDIVARLDDLEALGYDIGDGTGHQVAQGINDSTSAAVTQTNQLVSQVNAALDRIHTRVNIRVRSNGVGGVSNTGGVDTRAEGGPANAGETYLIGERGPELLHMGRNRGFVSPNGSWGEPIRVVSAEELARILDQRQGRLLALAPSSSYSR